MTKLVMPWVMGALLIIAGCDREEKRYFQGYVEGDYLYLATPVAGYLKILDAPRGSKVSAGQPVFSIADDLEGHALAEALARKQAAIDRVANLQEPRRTTEIDALKASQRVAEAALRLSEAQLKRQLALAKSQFISEEKIDELRAARDRDRAQVESLREQIKTSLASVGREAEVRAAEAEVSAAEAQVAQRQWSIDNKRIDAPKNGEIADVFYQVGEWVPAGQPVVSLLPQDQRKLRFFVPEPDLSRLLIGAEVEARCDACPAPIRARIDFISPQAEYTPPVIFSRETRSKLVFRVEAAPLSAFEILHPGLPIEIYPVGG